MTADIQALVGRCQQGQLDAFSELFRFYQNRIYDLSCVVLQDEAEAEDAVQETFLRVFQNIDSYKGQAAFETWLVAITVNRCRSLLRKRRFRRALSLESLAPGRLIGAGSRGEDVADLIDERQRRQSLRNVVDCLDDRLRLPMVLRYRYGLSCGEIASVIGRRKSTIYQYLHEGRREIERRLREQPGVPLVTPSEEQV